MVKKKQITVTGKRKTAVARAKISAGTGKIIINSKPMKFWGNEISRMKLKEPLILAGDSAKKVDIHIIAKSGGTTGQTDAIRMVIARGLVEFFKDEKMRQRFIQYNRNLLVFDPRRTEPRKPSRSRKGSRRHKQRSKR